MKFEKEQKFWGLVVLTMLLVGLIWTISGVFSIWLGFRSSFIYASSIFEDDFEAYNLGGLDQQGGWWVVGTYDGEVIDDPTAEGSRSANFCGTNGYSNTTRKSTGSPLTIGTTWFYIMPILSAWDSIAMGDVADPFTVNIKWAQTSQADLYFQIFNGTGWIAVDNFAYDPDIDGWIKIGIDWNSTTHKFKFFIDDGWTSEYTWANLDNAIDRFNMAGSCDIGHTTYIDFISSTGELPAIEPRVWGIDPVSGTEITDLETSFEFGWEGLDDWDTLSVVFQNRATGIFSEAQDFIIETTSPSGLMVLNLQDFNFERNGIFYFFATATRTIAETIQGMFLTGRWSYEWSEDLVAPEYYLIINIEGLTPIFETSDFNDWYSVNSKFDEPTDMFSAIAGFFSPIFSKIGEFGSRIEDYFNVNEAYAQGFEIGKSVPYFTYFVGQISLFLGGFPVMKWVFVLILLMTGIFIFRIILKFIPGLG